MTSQAMEGSFLRRARAILPARLAAEIDALVSASPRLREERELAFYGDEETDTEAVARQWAIRVRATEA